MRRFWIGSMVVSAIVVVVAIVYVIFDYFQMYTAFYAFTFVTNLAMMAPAWLMLVCIPFLPTFSFPALVW